VSVLSSTLQELADLVYDEHCPGWRTYSEDVLGELSAPLPESQTLESRLEQSASEQLGTRYRVYIERDVCRRSHEVTLRCVTCRAAWWTFWDDNEHPHDECAEIRVSTLIKAVLHDRNDDKRTDVCRCVDGLTAQQCLERYITHQRTESGGKRGMWSLTPRQLAAASLAWSSHLRAKQQQVREKERVGIVCERDEDGL
jgi:hypothetical protein